MKALLRKWLRVDTNENNRQQWLVQTLGAIPPGLRVLDAGAGELRNRPLCSHLNYVSQDACQYEGKGDSKGLQTGEWDTSQIDLVCDILNIPEPNASFDAILCSEVFEHLPDAVKALDEFERLLEVPEPELLAWVMGQEPTPHSSDTPMFRKMCDLKRGAT